MWCPPRLVCSLVVGLSLAAACGDKEGGGSEADEPAACDPKVASDCPDTDLVCDLKSETCKSLACPMGADAECCDGNGPDDCRYVCHPSTLQCQEPECTPETFREDCCGGLADPMCIYTCSGGLCRDAV